MSGIIIPQRSVWTRQPQYPVQINGENRFTRGLVFAYEGSFSQYDLITNTARNALGSGASDGVGPYGRQIDFSGTVADGACLWPSHTSLYGATETTVDILFYLANVSASPHLFHQWNAGTNHWLLQPSTTNLVWVAAEDNSNNRRRWDLTGAFPTAGWYRVIASWQGGANKCLYINGVDKTQSLSAVNAIATQIRTTGTSGIQIGTTTAGNDLTGSVVFARAFKRGMSNAEVAEYARLPYWSIYQDQEDIIFIDVSDGSALNINCTLGTADASGYTASVDLQNSITATLGTAAASGYDATVDRQLGVSATLGTASASGYDAGIDRQLGIAATVGSASASGYDASITFGNDLSVIASLGLASADGYQASVNLQNDISATLGTAAASGYTASLSFGDAPPLVKYLNVLTGEILVLKAL